MLVVLSFVILTLFVGTCSWLLEQVAGFGMPTPGHMIVRGSLFTLGFCGFMGGEIIVLIGSVIALRIKTEQPATLHQRKIQPF